MYDAIANQESIPVPPKPWRRLSAIDKSRILGARAAWRRKNQGDEYKSIGAWVKAIREGMKKTRAEFAKILGINASTLNRWEEGRGYFPSENPRWSKKGKKQLSNMARLRGLESTLARLKSEGLEFDKGEING